ncbi:hypothetical protein [Bordetella bronchiseptica]|uniref:hypothetical protein n=1 Tax=Bordetella bronchiseptica TaxID=518 RepID=UPI0018E59F12|nr:hypothetical protein [Bordetella bronchiseptica]
MTTSEKAQQTRLLTPMELAACIRLFREIRQRTKCKTLIGKRQQSSCAGFTPALQKKSIQHFPAISAYTGQSSSP